MKFQLPDQLPKTRAELEELATKARAELNVYLARRAAGQAEEFTADDLDYVKYLTGAAKTVDTELAAVAAAEKPPVDVNALMDEAAAAAKPAAAPAAPEVPADKPADDAAAAEAVKEAEKIAEEAAAPAAVTASGTPGGTSPFAGAVINNSLPADSVAGDAKGWELLPSAPKYGEFASDEKVGFREIAESIASVKSGAITGCRQTGSSIDGNFATQAIARLKRNLGPEVDNDPEAITAALARIGREVPGHGKVTAKALVAAGGWCAPSEQLYDFCPVPAAADLLSLPDFVINRGGVRFPVNPDVSALLTKLWHFTETELEAVGGGGDPTAVKQIIELPCPDQFIEYRLEAIGWAAKAGILQRQAWPESIANALEQIQAAHQHRVSQLSIGKVVAGSGSVKVVPTETVLGATSSVLNGLDLQAQNLRYNKGLSGDATIEGIAPVWFRSVLRADLAMREGKDFLAVSDSEIDSWLAVRNIYLQYVVDWQTRGAGQPGHMSTLHFPAAVDVVLYPAGTWFRSLDPVITLGVQYPIEQLTLNQYTHIFTEDQFQVGKRCDQSINVRVPLCVNGAVGARETIECNYTGVETVTATIITTGSPAGGTFTLKFSENLRESGTIAYGASASTLKSTVAAIDDNALAAAFSATGGALPTAVVLTYPAELGELTLGTNSLTGGTSPNVSITIA